MKLSVRVLFRPKFFAKYVDSLVIGDWSTGPITTRLNEFYHELVVKDTERSRTEILKSL